jgi:hypothetical protein
MSNAGVSRSIDNRVRADTPFSIGLRLDPVLLSVM